MIRIFYSITWYAFFLFLGTLLFLFWHTKVFAYDSITVTTDLHDSQTHWDATQYGQARHIIVDNYGHFIAVYIDGNNGDFAATPLILFYSNDRGANWTDVPQTGIMDDSNRPALAYDAINDKVHMVYQASDPGNGIYTGLMYRRYTISRDGSNNITDLTLDGEMNADKNNCLRPTIIYTTNGGTNGTIVVSWSRGNDAATRTEVRISMRNLSNNANDFVASNWSPPDGTSDSTTIQEPEVPYNLVEAVDGVGGVEYAISCICQRSQLGATHENDLYIIYSMYAGGLDEWRWRKADWNASNNDWSSGIGDWSSATTIVSGNFSSGRDWKWLTGSCVYDEIDDYIWISLARYASGSDIITLYGITHTDANFDAGDIYSASPNTNRHPMTAAGFDQIEQGGRVWVAYITGDAEADGYVRYKTYKLGTGFIDSGDLYAVSGEPHNYPNIMMYRHNDLMMSMFRLTITDSYTVRIGKIELTGNSAKPTGLMASSGDGEVALNWSSPDYNGGSAVTDYTIEYREGTSGTFSMFADGVSSDTTANVTGLINEISYQFRVSAVNAYGTSNPSDIVLETPHDVTPPILANISSNPVSNGATITWTTNEQASSQVEYGVSSLYGTSTIERDTSPRVINHSVELTNLVECTTYHYRVKSTDSASLQTISADYSFTTTGCVGSAAINAQISGDITSTLGGTISLMSNVLGIFLEVPVDFSGSNANFQIKQLDSDLVLGVTSTPSGYSLIGDYLYDLKALSSSFIKVTHFDNKITITIYYDDSDLTSVDETQLQIYRWDGSSWIAVKSTIDTVNNTISAETLDFSIFALFGTRSDDQGQLANAGSEITCKIFNGIMTLLIGIFLAIKLRKRYSLKFELV